MTTTETIDTGTVRSEFKAAALDFGKRALMKVGEGAAVVIGAALPLSAGFVVSTHLPATPALLHQVWVDSVLASSATGAWLGGRNVRREFLSIAEKCRKHFAR